MGKRNIPIKSDGLLFKYVLLSFFGSYFLILLFFPCPWDCEFICSIFDIWYKYETEQLFSSLFSTVYSSGIQVLFMLISVAPFLFMSQLSKKRDVDEKQQQQNAALVWLLWWSDWTKLWKKETKTNQQKSFIERNQRKAIIIYGW